LQEHAGNLEHKVQERTALLHDTIAQLESFSYTIAHDLRAPIRALQGYSEILGEEFGHLLPAEGKTTVSRLARASKRLDVLTRDLLRFSKIVRADVELEPVDVADVVEELKSEAPQMIQSALLVQPPLGVARAQRTLLQQCLANLLENAGKFANPQRNLCITIRSEQAPERTRGASTPSLAFNPATFGAPKTSAETAAAPKGSWLRIWVEDNGIGIPERARSKIFGIFERSAGSENIEGTGIGLAIVARAMQQMGGFCGVESKVGEGSRFWLELPSCA
jgi:signal transduction histidine kinase